MSNVLAGKVNNGETRVQLMPPSLVTTPSPVIESRPTIAAICRSISDNQIAGKQPQPPILSFYNPNAPKQVFITKRFTTPANNSSLLIPNPSTQTKVIIRTVTSPSTPNIWVLNKPGQVSLKPVDNKPNQVQAIRLDSSSPNRLTQLVNNLNPRTSEGNESPKPSTSFDLASSSSSTSNSHFASQ